MVLPDTSYSQPHSTVFLIFVWLEIIETEVNITSHTDCYVITYGIVCLFLSEII